MKHVTAKIAGNKYETVLTNHRHNIIADEPVEENGTDLGPTPEELLMMSLASCTAITLRMYADRKQWSAHEINVSVGMSKEEQKTVFTRSVFIKGPLNDDEKQRMMKVADACPVHKILTHPIEVNTFYNTEPVII